MPVFRRKWAEERGIRLLSRICLVTVGILLDLEVCSNKNSVFGNRQLHVGKCQYRKLKIDISSQVQYCPVHL